MAELIRPAMIPICRKRGFATGDILHNWSGIIGGKYGDTVKPEKLIWPRVRAEPDQPVPEKAILFVRTDSATSVKLLHEIPQLIERINSYFGWNAVGEIRIKNHPVERIKRDKPDKLRSLTPGESKKLREKLTEVGKDDLREALLQLGEAIIARRNPAGETETKDRRNS